MSFAGQEGGGKGGKKSATLVPANRSTSRLLKKGRGNEGSGSGVLPSTRPTFPSWGSREKEKKRSSRLSWNLREDPIAPLAMRGKKEGRDLKEGCALPPPEGGKERPFSSLRRVVLLKFLTYSAEQKERKVPEKKGEGGTCPTPKT